MAIQYVGGRTDSRLGATSNYTVSLTGLTGGVGTAPATGDLVVVTNVIGSTANRHASTAVVSPSGYTDLTRLDADGTTYDATVGVSYKFMGATPDTTVTLGSSGSVDDGQAVIIQVFRGVDPTNPLDVAAVTATGSGTGRPNPAAITPTTTGAWIVVCSGAANSGQGGGLAYPDLTSVLIDGALDTNDPIAGCGLKTDWTSGAFDCGQATSGPTAAAASWAAYTLALRPEGAGTTHNLGGALTASATVSAAAKVDWAAVGLSACTATVSAALGATVNCIGLSECTASVTGTLFSGERIDAVAEIKALRITAGDYTGGYELAPNGKFNWYFANLALKQVVPHLSSTDLDTYVRVYLDLYLAKNDATYHTIQDVDFPTGRAGHASNNYTLVQSDSDDSYAATYLSLVYAFYQEVGNTTWVSANLAALKDIAYACLATQQKPTGLIRVFRSTSTPNNSDIGYLMDNAECYRGLRDFQALLTALSDADASYYGTIADSVAAGIGSLWDSSASAYRPSDAHTVAETTFYPGTTCQVFPEVFGVSEESARFTSAYGYLNTNKPNWPTLDYDTFPWTVLGYAAFIRDDTTKTDTQRDEVEALFLADRAKVTINELGWYLGYTGVGQDIALAGGLVSAATVAGALSIAKPMAAGITSSATVTGEATFLLAADATGSASVTGDLAVTKPLAGLSECTAAAAGELTLTLPLVGLSECTAAVTGALSITVNCIGLSECTAVVSGQATVVGGLGADITATSAVSGELSLDVPLAAAATCTATVTAAASMDHGAAGTVAAEATTSASLSLDVPLAGALTATATVEADPVGTLSVAGSLAATGSVAGTLSKATHFAGGAAANTAVTGALQVNKPLAGALSATAGVTGVATRGVNLAADATGSAQVSGAASLQLAASAAVAAGASVTGALSIDKPLAGSLAASAQATGAATRGVHLGGMAAAGASVTSALSISTHLFASIQAAADLVARLQVLDADDYVPDRAVLVASERALVVVAADVERVVVTAERESVQTGAESASLEITA